MKKEVLHSLKVDRVLSQKTVMNSRHTDRILADIVKPVADLAMKTIYIHSEQEQRKNGTATAKLCDNDERHICPLQLDVIERGLQLWSNPNDIVLSPFMGIGSEGFVSIKTGRRFVGIELKESYFNQAVKNMERAKNEVNQSNLFEVIN